MSLIDHDPQAECHRPHDRDLLDWYESRITCEQPSYGIDAMLRADGYYRLPDVVMQSSKGAALTLAVIMDHCDGKGRAYPGIDRISELARQSRRTTIRHCAQLVQDKHLAKTTPSRGSNRYQVPARLFNWFGPKGKQRHGRLPTWWPECATGIRGDRYAATLVMAVALDHLQMLEATDAEGAGLEGREYLTFAYLARRTGLSRRTVPRALTALRDAGWLIGDHANEFAGPVEKSVAPGPRLIERIFEAEQGGEIVSPPYGT